MAAGRKVHMSSVAGLPVRTLRRIVGIRAHRPGANALCVGGQLSGKTYAKPAKGLGGQNNVAVQNAFSAAAKSCGGGRGRTQSRRSREE